MQQSPGDWSHLFGTWVCSHKLIKMVSPKVHAPPFVSPFDPSLSFCWEGGGGGEPGARAKPGRGRGWGLMDYALMETLSMKWPSEVTLPGQVLRSHEHTAGAGAGWGSGAIGRACGKRLAGMLLYVLFSLPPICSWTRVLGCHWELHLLCFRGSHSTTACKYRTNCLLVWLMNWMEKLWWFALVSNSGDVVLTISSSWCNMTLIQHKSGSLCFLFCLRF